jgi:ATP-dependent DNA helicase RecQ
MIPSTPVPDEHPDTAVDLLDSLQRHFGHQSFRAGQEVVVRTVLDGQDLLAVMPTGSGKSLGFQLPAILLPGVTLVVSPLISLMKDQVDELNRRGIRAEALHSLLTADERRQTVRGACAGDLRLLYVAPERFASDRFLRLLGDVPIARFVVDEAHCVSEWGHDFRPDYRRLAAVAGACQRSDGQPGRPPMAAFTATATPEVRQDISDLLGLQEPRLVVAGFDRPNILLEVRPVSGDLEKQALLPGLVNGRRALVYASTRRSAETAAETLRVAGVNASAYHAGLGEAERTRVQDAFAAGGLQVVCATNAFGMGIDRPDVGAVVHVDVPGSLEAYYQEIGRGGRDGRPAIATLLWNYADVKTREFLIDRGRDDLPERLGLPAEASEVARRRQIEHRKLRRMVAYADTTGCLRATILRYFGDRPTREPCESCGNCARRARLDSGQLLLVRKILSGIARAGERYGRRKVTAMLVGNLDGLPEPLARLTTTGLLRGQEPRQVARWLDATCDAGLVAVSADEYRTLSLTPLGRDVMRGRVEEVYLAIPAVRATRSGSTRRDRRRGRMAVSEPLSTPESAPHPGVVEALRAWRLEEARRRGIAPFVILHDRTLMAIAGRLPRSAGELGGIPGIGPAKLSAYGEAILSLIGSTLASQHGSG